MTRSAGLLRRVSRLAAVVLLIHSVTATLAAAAEVKKLADDFESVAWHNGIYNTAGGVPLLSDDVPSDITSKHSLMIQAHFTGTFGGYSVQPNKPLIIPGEAKSITLRVKAITPNYGLKMTFRDGWGREKVDGKYLSWGIPLKNAQGEWATVTFKVPKDWVMPLEITGLTTDNWEAKTEKKNAELLVDQLEVSTDLANVDPKTGVLKTWTADPSPEDTKKTTKSAPLTPLVKFDLATPEQGNVFVDAPPSMTFKVQNWNSGDVSGQLKYRLLDSAGQVQGTGEQPFKVESLEQFDLPLKADRYGLYTFEGELTFNGTTETHKLAYAKLPKQRELTDEQKNASPYGLNYHGAGALILKPFRQAGIVWFREYAFSYEWLLRAKGAGDYAGWPSYPKILKAYEEVGAGTGRTW